MGMKTMDESLILHLCTPCGVERTTNTTVIIAPPSRRLWPVLARMGVVRRFRCCQLVSRGGELGASCSNNSPSRCEMIVESSPLLEFDDAATSCNVCDKTGETLVEGGSSGDDQHEYMSTTSRYRLSNRCSCDVNTKNGTSSVCNGSDRRLTECRCGGLNHPPFWGHS